MTISTDADKKRLVDSAANRKAVQKFEGIARGVSDQMMLDDNMDTSTALAIESLMEKMNSKNASQSAKKGERKE